MQRSRRALLRPLGVTLAGLALSAATGCRVADMLPRAAGQSDRAGAPPDNTPEPIVQSGQPARTGQPGQDDAVASLDAAEPIDVTPAPAGSMAATPAIPASESTPGPILTVAVPPTPTSVPPTPIPTPTPRPRPTRALVVVPYYSQRVGRLNYCLPTSIAMIADRYNRLPTEVSGTPDKAPRFVVDVAYGYAKQKIAGLSEKKFKALWEEIGTDPLGGLIWDVIAPNGRDLAAGMSPALAYLVLRFAFGLTPVLGTLEECLVALSDDIPSILFGTYGALRRADGMPGNVDGYAGDHALVLVGIDYDRVLVNDPLPTDKTRYSGERSRSTASLRAVRFDLASVQRMTVGDGGKPRGDCFMVPPNTA